jgi:hypothetical protein
MLDQLSDLTQTDLKEIYSDPEGVALGRFAINPANLEERKRWRKYAYAQYWERRLNEQRALSEDEIHEWPEYIALDFLNNVACGVIGEAARRNLLPESVLRRLEAAPAITSHAARQLRARLALAESAVEQTLIDRLLDLKASWALHEILARDLKEGEVALFEAASQDKRLSRIERHHLREALRHRRR